MKFEKVDLASHAQQLFDMDRNTFTRSFDFPATKLEHTVNYLKDCDIYLAYEGDTVIGVMAFAEHEGSIEVKQIVVLKEFQHKGHGKQIVQKLLELTKGKKVWLVTHPKNTAALLLYLKSGFEITGWKENYYGNGQPRLMLSLDN